MVAVIKNELGHLLKIVSFKCKQEWNDKKIKVPSLPSALNNLVVFSQDYLFVEKCILTKKLSLSWYTIVSDNKTDYKICIFIVWY